MSEAFGSANLPLDIDDARNVATGCLRFLDDYGAARPALLRHHITLRNLPGGPWSGRLIRTGGPGGAQLSYDGEIHLVHPTGEGEGLAQVRDFNPHAPFKDFQLIDATGVPAAPGTPAFIAQRRYAFWLDRTRDAVNALIKWLPTIERLKVQGEETQSITRLRVGLPAPPYVPITKSTCTFNGVGEGWNGKVRLEVDEPGVPCDEWEEVIAQEAKLIGAARTELHRFLVFADTLDVRPVGAGDVVDEGKAVERFSKRAEDLGYYSPTDIARTMNVPDSAEAIRKALKRLMDKNRLPDKAYMENNDPAKGQAKILYSLPLVRPFLSRFEASENL